jgi:hypothetical protein
MVSIFNWKYRRDSRLVSALKKKIRQSQLIIKKGNDIREIYTLDDIVILFKFDSNMLTVKTKSGEQIVDLNCAMDGDKLQSARFDLFHKLLQFARDEHNHNQEFVKARERLRAMIKELDDAANKKADVEKAIADARKKLKSL